MAFAIRAAPLPGLDMASATSAFVAIATSIPTIAATVAMSAADASSSTLSSSASDEPEETGECRLLGPFAILIQSALGALALLSLVYKRWRERPQRPVKIWAFDASKQVVGSVLLHLVNLAMSELSSGAFEVVAAATKGAQGVVDLAASAVGDEHKKRMQGMGVLALRDLSNALSSLMLLRREEADEVGNPAGASAADGEVDISAMAGNARNPCSFYLLNLAIDTTVGIPILIILLRLVTAGAALTPLARPPESIQSGNYGRPPRATWWLKQCLIYFIGLLGMKLCVFFIFQLCPWLGAVGDWALRWTEGDERLQIFFVMLFFPLVMNAMQYYIIDGFIKEQKPKEGQAGAGASGGAGGSYEQVGQDEREDDHADTLVASGSDSPVVGVDAGNRRTGAGPASGASAGDESRFAGSERTSVEEEENLLDEDEVIRKVSDDSLIDDGEHETPRLRTTGAKEYDPKVDGLR